MVIPLRDIQQRQRFPIVNLILIAANVVLFFYELSLGSNLEGFLRNGAFVPSRFFLPGNTAGDIESIFLSMFLHGGWAHILGNMLYLWIFGDNVEDSFGHVKYIIFYLLCGLAATFAQLIFSVSSNVPNLGASGAIAGVLGAYIVLFPKGQVRVLQGQSVIPVPALIVIGLWIVLQFFSGIGSISSAEQGGVAYMAHIGGFVAGLVLTFLFRGSRGAEVTT